jgi:hypothetical protein
MDAYFIVSLEGNDDPSGLFSAFVIFLSMSTSVALQLCSYNLQQKPSNWSAQII